MEILAPFSVHPVAGLDRLLQALHSLGRPEREAEMVDRRDLLLHFADRIDRNRSDGRLDRLAFLEGDGDLLRLADHELDLALHGAEAAIEVERTKPEGLINEIAFPHGWGIGEIESVIGLAFLGRREDVLSVGVLRLLEGPDGLGIIRGPDPEPG